MISTKEKCAILLIQMNRNVYCDTEKTSAENKSLRELIAEFLKQPSPTSSGRIPQPKTHGK